MLAASSGRLLPLVTLPSHLQELANDPLNINRPSSKLQHQLPLGSAYAAVLDSQDGGPLQQKQRRQMDVKHREPKVSTSGRQEVGVGLPCCCCPDIAQWCQKHACCHTTALCSHC